MSVQSATMPFPARLKTPFRIDPVLMSMTTALTLGGLVILASASVSISDNAVGEPFYYVKRQAIAAIIGGAFAYACLFIPMHVWQKLGPLMLLAALALLVVVLLPGFGYTVN
ncbi:MAG: FtsW/RodA/SpoVE family cell cycle protein, partial [Woeseia sp.]